ncbi:hypothetical protein Plec18170_005076 [Paecilomyces lecythidis]
MYGPISSLSSQVNYAYGIVLMIKNVTSVRNLPEPTRLLSAHGGVNPEPTSPPGPTEVLASSVIDNLLANFEHEVKNSVSRVVREVKYVHEKDAQNLRQEIAQQEHERQIERQRREEAQTSLEREGLCRGREREELLAESSRKSQRIEDLERMLEEERARGQLLSEQKREAEYLNTKAQDQVYRLKMALGDQEQMEENSRTSQEKIETLSTRITEEEERNKEEIRKNGVLEAEKLGLQEELKHLQEKYGEEQTRANNLMRDYAQALQDNEALHRRNADNEAENNALRVQNEELERKCAEQKRSIEQLQAAHGHIQQEHDQLRASYSSLEEQHLVLTRTHAELQNSKELLKARYVRAIVALARCYRNKVMCLREDLDALWTAYTDSEGHSLDLQDNLDVLREPRRNTAAREWQNGEHDGIRRPRVQEPALVRRKSEMAL